MTSRTEPPFRADHVGSLLRPPALIAARAAHETGEIDMTALRAAEDEAIRDVVAMQERVGCRRRRTASSGARRGTWTSSTGSAGSAPTSASRCGCTAPRGTPRSPRPVSRPIFADDFVFLQSAVTTAVPKLTIPSPSMVHYRGGTAAVDRSVYPDKDEFWAELSAAYADEVRALGDLGCRYLQLDDTSLAYLNDPAQRAAMAARGGCRAPAPALPECGLVRRPSASGRW